MAQSVSLSQNKCLECKIRTFFSTFSITLHYIDKLESIADTVVEYPEDMEQPGVPKDWHGQE